jgi:hypothetical protein
MHVTGGILGSMSVSRYNSVTYSTGNIYERWQGKLTVRKLIITSDEIFFRILNGCYTSKYIRWLEGAALQKFLLLLQVTYGNGAIAYWRERGNEV